MSRVDTDTRQRILEKTWQLMERKRGRPVRIEDIARAAGVSRQAVYLHFGSRTGLLIAATHYVDKVKDVDERVRGLRQATDAQQSLDALVEFWGNYMPEIHGLATALLATRATDKAAAAAWNDRMDAILQCCHSVVRCIVREELLAPEWSVAEAGDAMWAMLSIEVWERLTQERGWSNGQYIAHMKAALKRTFVK